MSTVLRPVGRQPARVYWVRRLLVLLVAVVVVGGLWAALSGMRGADEDPSTGAAAQGSDDAPEGTAVEPDPGGPGPCTGGDIALTLSPETRVFAEGTAPTLVLAVTNAGAQSCTIDVGPASREVLITSGTDRIWSSLDCPAPEGEERMLLLEPGARETTTVTWDRVRSAEGCPADLPEPLPGTYTAVASMLGVQSATAVFELG